MRYYGDNKEEIKDENKKHIYVKTLNKEKD